MQKGISSIFLIIGLLVIALIGGAIYLGKVGTLKTTITKAPPQTTQSPSIEKSELKTYTNNQAGYSIEYPNSLTHSPSSYDSTGGTVTVDSWSPANNTYSIWVYSYKEGVQSRLEFNAKTETDESILIAGQKVRKLIGSEIVSEKGILIHAGPLKNKEQNYMFIYSSGNLKAESKDIAIFDQMLSTFQLLNSISDTTNWKTYTNSKYGFELQHPANSTVEALTAAGVSPHQYIRIQNYTDKEVIENKGKLVTGQYYLEITIYDYQLGHKSSEKCPENIANPKKVDLGAGVTAYRGNGLGGGDSAPFIYAICANKPNVDYYIQASENFETVASKIIDSFKFN